MKALKVFAIIIGLAVYWGMNGYAMPSTQESRDEHWRKDLHFLASYLEECHPNLFFKIKPEEYHAAVGKVDNDIPNLSDNEIMVRMMQLTAMCGDAHTSFEPLQQPMIKKIYPFFLEWFSDGIYITKASEQYRELIGCKIIKWNKLPTEKVVEKLASIIAQENPIQIHAGVYLLRFPDILNGLGLAQDSSSIQLEVEDDKGTRRITEVSVFPLSMLWDKHFWGKNSANENLPLYRRNSYENYWYNYLPTEKVLYLKYNRCAQMEGQTFDSIRSTVLQNIDNENVDKLVIDLRDNWGGNARIFEPMIQEIKDREKVNRKGHLFVIIGKYTFSAAAMHAVQLKTQTNAILIGEGTQGKPNFYADPVKLVLPHSGLVVNCSKDYVHTSDIDTSSLVPDVVVDLTAQDYFSNKDPLFDWILNYHEDL